MATSPEDVRDRLVRSAEQCYYNGSTAGQMWLHDLSTYLQGLAADDPRLARIADRGQMLDDAEAYLCDRPPALVQAFDPSAWLDGYAARAA